MFKGIPAGLFPSLFSSTSLQWPARRHWLLALACAAVFAILMPGEEAFPYRFQQGQPWSYRSLNAPFDYEVLYPDEQVQMELEQVKAEHAPYFKLDPEVARQQKKRFSRLVEEQAKISRHDTQFEDLVHNQAAYIAVGNQLLDMIYNQGITDPGEESFRDTPGFIYIVAGLMERKVPVQEVGTLNSARSFLSDSLPFSSLRQPELILPILERSLVLNTRYSDSLTITQKRRKLAAVKGTGIMVHKGEQIVQPGQIVTLETQQKLQSLQRRYQSEQVPFSSAGKGLLAFLIFVGLLWGMHYLDRNTTIWFPMVAVTALFLSLITGWLGRVGETVALLLPLWAAPLLFRQMVGTMSTGKLIWIAVMLLTTISFQWAGGWLILQTAGLLAFLFFLEPQTQWKNRIMAGGGIWLAQVSVMIGLALAGLLPETMPVSDSIIFLLLAVLCAFAVYPLRLSRR